ncbi:Trans-aconitate 2-methyltransferase [Gimesia chilikensis]|uniref:Trans-aconitate 2-methyltransferase n=1 Tax=Gimesia chilikensis TaxID=2605989 RepID=A0A517WGM6_9PLAN|nr:class I SAM-dependent methyltransferase [Gimesia chilikensis]QDU04404.1 Trans-aconitate 2-methyltransferase [Gimesia chilikensis]
MSLDQVKYGAKQVMKMNRVDHVTVQLLEEAQISAGMHVLDLGCGSGDVSRLIAARVGKSGRVYGFDRSVEAIAEAQKQTVRAGFDNIEFTVCDLEGDSALPVPLLDAVVGRRVLMYLQNRTGLLKRLSTRLKPNGTIAFQEHCRTMTPGRIGVWPVHDLWYKRVWDTVLFEGADPDTGLRLPVELSCLGFEVTHVGATGLIAGFERGRHTFLEFVQMMIPRMVKAGVINESQTDLGELAHQMNMERSSNESVYVTDLACSVVAKL